MQQAQQPQGRQALPGVREAPPSANRSPSGPTAIPLGKCQASGVSGDGFHFCFLKKSGVLKST